MAKGLKGITVKIDGDARPLNQALSKINAETRSLQGELKGVNSLLKFDPQNTELEAQKQTVLKQAIAETENKLKLLVQAQKEMSEAGKDVNDEGYRDLQREIVATQQKLAKYNSELKDTEKQQKQAAKEAETLGQKIYKIASHIPVVNKLADGFVKAKQKIAETVKESAAVQKIGSAIEGAKRKVEAFQEAHPAVKKVSETFREVGEKAADLAHRLPSVSDGLKSMGKAAGHASVEMLKIGAVAAGAVAAGFGYTIKVADEAKGALNDFSASTGITGDGLKEFESVMKEIYADNFGENMQDIAESMAVVQRNSRLIDPAETKKVTEYAIALQDTFGYDIQEQMRAANMLIDQFGVTGEEAFNLIAQGAQDGWLDKNGDMLDSINEYSVHFKQLGLGAEEMFNVLANGAYSGTFSVDKCGDAIKEFGIRVKDGSDSSRAAFEYLGYNADELFRVFNEGGEEAADMTQILIDELASMPEGIEKTTAGVALFGTMWEDLGAEGIQALSDVRGEFDKTKNAMQQINAIKYDTFGEAMQGVGRILQMNFIAPIGEEALPVFTEFAKELSKGALEAEGDINKMGEAAAEAVGGLLEGLGDMIPQMAQTLMPIVTELTLALVAIVPGILEQSLPALTNGFITLMKAVTATWPTLLPQILNAAITLFGGLLQGLNEIVPQIMAMLPTLIQTICSTLTANLPQLITEGVQILVSIISGITQAIPTLISAIVELIPVIVQTIVENLPLIIDAGLNLLLSLISGIIQAIPQLIATLPQIITSIVSTIAANLPKIIQTGIELLGALISGIILAIPSLIAALPQVFNAIFKAFKGINWAELGKNIIDGVIKGVKNAANSLIKVFKDLAESALDAIKSFFGIASPSKVMRDQVGKMLPAGMAEGVEEGMDEEERRIKAAMARGVPTTIDSYMKSRGSSAAAGSTRAEGGGFTQNLTINSPRELSPSETARLNRNTMQQTMLKIKTA